MLQSSAAAAILLANQPLLPITGLVSAQLANTTSSSISRATIVAQSAITLAEMVSQSMVSMPFIPVFGGQAEAFEGTFCQSLASTPQLPASSSVSNVLDGTSCQSMALHPIVSSSADFGSVLDGCSLGSSATMPELSTSAASYGALEGTSCYSIANTPFVTSASSVVARDGVGQFNFVSFSQEEKKKEKPALVWHKASALVVLGDMTSSSFATHSAPAGAGEMVSLVAKRAPEAVVDLYDQELEDFVMSIARGL